MKERARVMRDIAVELAKNAAMAVPIVRTLRLQHPRTASPSAESEAQLERFAFAPLRQLLQLNGSVRGASIAEIGPGDYLTSGLAMLAAGAARYAAIERFVGDYRGPGAKAWYRMIEADWPRAFPELPWPSQLSGATFPETCEDRVEVIAKPIEDVDPARRFDIVCSFQVGEHVTDIDVLAQIHRRLMKPEGIAVHRVDFAPHDRWQVYGDPLTFLRPPDWLWQLMGSHRGIPNRRRHHEFVAAFERAGMRVQTLDVMHFDENRIDLAKLAPRFRSMPAESLRVASVVYVCRGDDAVSSTDRRTG